jgi:hypothetical protein
MKTFVADLLTIFGVLAALLVPLDARADDLSAADLEAIDQAITASSAPQCAEPRDHLRSLRDAYHRQEAPVVRGAIAARVPMVLDTLRFCIETTGATPSADTIEPARQALASARTRAECSVPAAGIEQLIAAWEAESSPVVRGAIESRLETLSQTVRFCLETLGPESVPAPAPPILPATTPVTVAPEAVTVEPTPVVSTPEVAPIAPELAPIAPLATGGRALGSPFRPPS